ncbi:MAG: high-affinity iron transporter [Actinomycetota bacterium]|jgi:iron uptake system component EfeO|nr:high-affinity iron transporter [Actinomycetota bacterium]
MPRRLFATAALLVVPLLVAACSSDSGPKGTATAGAGPTIEVTLSDKGCEPRAISTPPGPTKFHVTNQGTAAVTEFEVLTGTRILGEVENVIPGADRSFSLTLAAGSYSTKCPGGSDSEGGTVQVTG